MGSFFNTGYGECWDGSIGKRVTTHRMAYRLFIGPVEENEMIDHKCGIKGCVNPEHLRKCSKSENGANRGKNKNNTSGLKGAYLDKRRNNWRSFIQKDGKQFYLGTFSSPEEAHIAYRAASLQKYGNFANSGVE
jgi:hypothetical protein